MEDNLFVGGSKTTNFFLLKIFNKLYYLKIMIIHNGKGIGFRISKRRSWMFSLACTELGTAQPKLVQIYTST